MSAGFPSGHVVLADEFSVLGNTLAVNGVGAVDSTTAAPFVSLAGSTSISFAKFRGTGTALKIELHVSCYSTVANTLARIGVLINGTDFNVSGLTLVTANEHMQLSGVNIVQANLAAGTYTVQARWGRVSGTGTLTRDANDWFSMAVTEVYT